MIAQGATSIRVGSGGVFQPFWELQPQDDKTKVLSKLNAVSTYTAREILQCGGNFYGWLAVIIHTDILPTRWRIWLQLRSVLLKGFEEPRHYYSHLILIPQLSLRK